MACLLLVAPYLWSRIASPWRRVQTFQQPSGKLPDKFDRTVRIACYNIAHGRGLSVSNWTSESRPDRLARLDKIAKLLIQLDADIVVLNEADFQSSWSHGVNQAGYLADKAGYSFWSEQRNLDFRVATYTWRFGNAVLSRYPIANADLVAFPGYRSWENWLAGRKCGLLCSIQLDPSVQLGVVAAHLSHRSEQVRVESAKMLCALANDSLVPLLVAGDLNSTPPGFAFSQETSDGKNALQVFDKSNYFLRRPQTLPGKGQLTFRADHPTRVIDWILIPQTANFVNYDVVPSELSDHRPVVAEIVIPLPSMP